MHPLRIQSRIELHISMGRRKNINLMQVDVSKAAIVPTGSLEKYLADLKRKLSDIKGAVISNMGLFNSLHVM